MKKPKNVMRVCSVGTVVIAIVALMLTSGCQKTETPAPVVTVPAQSLDSRVLQQRAFQAVIRGHAGSEH
jgi:hypothetical protein